MAAATWHLGTAQLRHVGRSMGQKSARKRKKIPEDPKSDYRAAVFPKVKPEFEADLGGQRGQVQASHQRFRILGLMTPP
jgi:hypothetical protein